MYESGAEFGLKAPSNSRKEAVRVRLALNHGALCNESKANTLKVLKPKLLRFLIMIYGIAIRGDTADSESAPRMNLTARSEWKQTKIFSSRLRWLIELMCRTESYLLLRAFSRVWFLLHLRLKLETPLSCDSELSTVWTLHNSLVFWQFQNWNIRRVAGVALDWGQVMSRGHDWVAFASFHLPRWLSSSEVLITAYGHFNLGCPPHNHRRSQIKSLIQQPVVYLIAALILKP